MWTLLKAHLDHKADVHGGAGSDGDHVNVPDVLRSNLPEKIIVLLDELTCYKYKGRKCFCNLVHPSVFFLSSPVNIRIKSLVTFSFR